jgi:hypothetical protein
MEEIIYPQTMLVMLEQAQAKAKEFGLALEQAQETIDRISLVAQVAQQESEMQAKEIKRLILRIEFRDSLIDMYDELNKERLRNVKYDC